MLFNCSLGILYACDQLPKYGLPFNHGSVVKIPSSKII